MYTQDYDSMTDEQVVRLAQGTDSQALEYLLNKYKNFVRTKARSCSISNISSRADMRVAPRPSMMVCSSASEDATRTSSLCSSISPANSSQSRSI